MIGGIGNLVTATALASFVNTVYARPWLSDERALLLPGILGGVIGYAIGVRIRQNVGKELFSWIAVAVAATVAVILSYAYNDVLLRLEAKFPWYDAILYSCFVSLNLAAFCAFGVIGWTLAGNREDAAED